MPTTPFPIAKAVSHRLAHACVSIVLVATAALLAAPAGAAASPLSCTGSTIYALQRPHNQSPSEHGVVFGLATSTVGGATATMTEVTQMPGESFVNALGVSAGGAGLYAVDQTGGEGSATVWAYDTSSKTWSSFLGSGGNPAQFVAGAVDPANGIYYYADYTSGTNSSPGKATLYGFNTVKDEAIVGVMATLNLPDGDTTNAQNGDFTFDANGNLYVLASDGATRAVGVVKAAAIPSTATGASLPVTTLSSVSDSATYNGIAFDNLGHLYLEGSSGGKYGVTEIDPNSGATLVSFTEYSANAQSGSNADVDLGSCAPVPTLTVEADVAGRVSPSDEFHLSVTGGSIAEGNTATTSGTSTGVQSQIAGPVIASSATTYTFTETAASGSLEDYDVTYSCIDTANGDSVIQSGSGTSFKLTFPTVTLGQASPPPAIVCTFETKPREADLGVTDAVAPETAPAGTQVTYTLTVTNHGPDTATNSLLTDALPTGVSIVSASSTQGSCTTTSGLECKLGTLTNGSSVKVTVTASVAGNASGELTDAAHTEAEQVDPNLANNKAHATITAVAAADLGVTDTVAPETAPAGTQVTYTLTVTNHGPDTATNSLLTDALPTGVSIVSASSTQGSCTTTSGLECKLGTITNGSSVKITVTASVAGNASGELTDAAHTEAEQADPNQANNKAHATITAVAAADLGVTDTVAPETAPAGTQVTYTLTVTNHGPDTATNSLLTDALPTGVSIVSATTTQGSCTTTSGLECKLGTITNGSSVKITVTASVAGNASGELTDAAHTEAEQADPNQANNKAHATITAVAAADLGVTDTVAPETAPAGTQVTYTLTVTNHGPDTATNSLLTDALPTGVSIVSATTTQGSCTTTSGLECKLGTITNGSSVKVTLTASVAGNASGELSDAAHTEAEQADPNQANNKAHATITAVAAADLGVTDSVAPETAPAGTQVTYTLTVTNHGPDTATNSLLTDTLPTGVSIVSASSTQGSCTTTSGLECKLGTLTNGSSAKVTLTAEVAGNASGELTDAAHTEAEQADPNLANNKAHATITAVAAADLGVTDSVAPETAPAGTQVTYTLTVTNHGPDTATNSLLTDTLPTGVSIVSASSTQGSCTTTSGLECKLGTITNGSSVKVTLTATVAGNASGELTDAAHTEAEQADPNQANNKAHATITAVAAADLGVTDTVAPETAPAGTQVTYTLTITNHGPDTATNSLLTDTLPTGVSIVSAATTQGSCTTTSGLECKLGTITNGSSVKVTVTASVAGNASGELTDAAHTEAEQADPNQANNKAHATITAVAAADLGVTDTVAPETAPAGTQVTYTLTVTNHGPDTATNSLLTDVLPTGVSIVSAATTQGSCTTTSGLECKLGTLTNGSSAKVTLTAEVAGNASGELTDAAHTEAEQADPNQANNKAYATITAVAAADLGVTDAVAPETAPAGTQVTYTLTVTNHGPDTATNSLLTDALPTGVSIVSASSTQGSCTTTSGLECKLGTLTNGSSVKVTVTASVAGNASGELTDAAHTEAEQVDPNLANNKAHATITAVAAADLGVTDTVAPETAPAGTQVTYTLTVTNHGPDTATNSLLTDALPTGVSIVSASSTQGSCTTTSGLECKLGTITNGSSVKITVTASVAGNASGELTDAAHTEAEQADPNQANNKAHATITAVAAADLGVTDTVAPETAPAGTQVTYTLTVTNHGPDTATNSLLTDALPTGVSIVSATTTQGSCTTTSGLECKLGTITNGSSVKITVTASVAGNASGELTDAAHTEAEQADPNQANNKAHATITAVAAADLGVTDTVAPETAPAGTQVTYTLTVTNHGPDTATNSLLTDALPTGVSIVSATTTQGSCTTTSGLECKLGTITNGSSVKVTLTASVAGNASGELSDAAHTEAEQADPNQANNKAHATITAVAAADLGVTDSVAPETAPAGTQVTYTLTVTNHGPDTATNSLLTDTLPTGVSIVSASSTQGSCTTTSGLECKLGTLTNGSSAKVTLTAEVAGNASGELTDAAHTEAEQADPNLANNKAHATITAVAAADLGVTDSVAPETAPAGTQVTYTLTVTNHGPDTATNSLLTDTLPTGVSIVSASSTQGSCTTTSGLECKLGTITNGSSVKVTLTATVAGNASGELTDAAHTEAEQADPNQANNKAHATITAVVPTPAPPPPEADPPAGTVDVQVTTRVDSELVHPGGLVTYTITVIELGTETAPQVVIVNTPNGRLRVLSAKSSRGTCATTRQVTCKLGDIAHDETITIVVQGVLEHPGELKLDSVATVGCTSSDVCPRDINLANNVDAAKVWTRAHIHLRETIERPIVEAGEEVPITLRVSNPSYMTLWNTRTCAQLPLGLVYLHSAQHATLSDGELCWKLGTLKKYRVKWIKLTTRALDGSDGRLKSHSVASAADAMPAHSRGAVMVLATLSRGPSRVTG